MPTNPSGPPVTPYPPQPQVPAAVPETVDPLAEPEQAPIEEDAE